jgi:hypothetical protein
VKPRFVIPSQDTKSSLNIPLRILQIEGGGYKVGIEVTLANPATGASAGPILYELDTGASGFFASIPPDDAKQFPMPSPQYGSVTDHYGSGISYAGQAVQVNLSFPGASTQAFPAFIGFIPPDGISGGTFPIYNDFYGDFGAAPSYKQPGGTNAFSLLTVLAQLGSEYGDGFVIDVGPFPGSGNAQLSPTLYAGLKDLRAAFPITVPMAKQGTYPPSGQKEPSGSIQTYGQYPTAGTLTVGKLSPLPSIPIVLDTGAPSTALHPGSALTKAYQPNNGDSFSLTAAASDANGNSTTVTILDFQAGDTPGLDQVKFETASSAQPRGDVNAGIAAFFASPIAFDLEQGVLRFPQQSAT